MSSLWPFGTPKPEGSLSVLRSFTQEQCRSRLPHFYNDDVRSGSRILYHGVNFIDALLCQRRRFVTGVHDEEILVQALVSFIEQFEGRGTARLRKRYQALTLGKEFANTEFTNDNSDVYDDGSEDDKDRSSMVSICDTVIEEWRRVIYDELRGIKLMLVTGKTVYPVAVEAYNDWAHGAIDDDGFCALFHVKYLFFTESQEIADHAHIALCALTPLLRVVENLRKREKSSLSDINVDIVLNVTADRYCIVDNDDNFQITCSLAYEIISLDTSIDDTDHTDHKE